MAAKRTWRKGMVVAAPEPKGPRWTAGEIMDRRALDRGFGECANRDLQLTW